MTPRPIAPKTWDAIWTDYLQGTVLHRVTFAALAAAHGVSAKTIGRHARIHHWDAKRRAAQVRDMLQLVEPDYQRSLRAFRSAVTRLMPLLRGEDFPAIHRVAWVDSAPWPAAWPAFGRKRRGPGRDPLCWLPRSSGPVRFGGALALIQFRREQRSTR